MRPIPRGVAEVIEEIQELDRLAEPVQKASKTVIPAGPIKEILSGTWLGHPLHPLLTDVVVGAWTSSFLLDFLGGKGARKSSDRLIGLGILAALPTAASGVADWQELWGKQRRVAITHALANVSALSLYALSWVARKREHRLTGRLFSLLGFGVATGSAYLGGHLSFGKGVGVNQTAFEEWPTEWTLVLSEDEVAEGKPMKAQAGDVGVFLYRDDERIYALSDRCSHRGCSLSDGEVDDGQITCPCHGSTFRLSDGEIVTGPATSPQPSYEVRVKEGKVEVRLPQK